MSDMIETPVVIIGGGLTGLSLAAGLDMKEIPFVLLEKENRVGGQVKTLRKDGFTFEVGPNTGTISNPEVVELFEYAAPDAILEVAQSASNARWIWKGGRFHPIPSGIISGLRTPLYSWKDKFRVPFEPFRKRGTDPNETVGALAERRLGKSIVDYTIDPFIGGVYAGDPYQLVTRVALPKLYRLEQTYGSFIGGAIKKAKEPKSEREKKATKKIFNAEGGLQSLVDSVAKKVAKRGEILLEVNNIKVRPKGDSRGPRYQVTFVRDGQERVIQCEYVVSTVRADVLPDIFPEEWSSDLEVISQFPYAPVAEVVVGFSSLPSIPRAAFGALVPSKEKRKILGILFPSSCFRHRTPNEDGALFTIFMGGLRNKDRFFGLSEEELRRDALEELYAMMRIPREVKPDLVHVARYAKAIPQYDRGTDERHRRIGVLERDFPGLFLAGGIRDGIGMANRIQQGFEISKLIAEGRGI